MSLRGDEMPVAKKDWSLFAANNQWININHNEEPSRHTAHLLYSPLYGLKICRLQIHTSFYILRTGLAVSIILSITPAVGYILLFRGHTSLGLFNNMFWGETQLSAQQFLFGRDLHDNWQVSYGPFPPN